MEFQFLRRVNGRFLNFCKYNKQKFLRTPRYLLTQRVKLFLKQNTDLNFPPNEVSKTLKFLKWNLVEVFNDPFVYSYDFKNYRVLWDKEKGLWFVYTPDGKKLYFKKGMSRKQVVLTYRFLEKEQDVRSPHYYFFDRLALSPNSIVADVGVAEGNFGLKIVDQVKELYLFECNAEWIEALNATFEPWRDKVHIVNTFVSETTTADSVRLDDFFKDKAVFDLLKLDVEGAEASAIDGALGLLKKGLVTDLLVCTYHKKGDAENLSAKLKALNYEISFSQGYMLFLREGYQAQPPYDFRKGLLHARRCFIGD